MLPIENQPPHHYWAKQVAENTHIKNFSGCNLEHEWSFYTGGSY